MKLNSVMTKNPILKPKLAAFLKSRLFLPTRRNISSEGYLALSKAQACYIIVICGVHWFLKLVVHFNLLEHLLKYNTI